MLLDISMESSIFSISFVSLIYIPYIAISSCVIVIYAIVSRYGISTVEATTDQLCRTWVHKHFANWHWQAVTIYPLLWLLVISVLLVALLLTNVYVNSLPQLWCMERETMQENNTKMLRSGNVSADLASFSTAVNMLTLVKLF